MKKQIIAAVTSVALVGLTVDVSSSASAATSSPAKKNITVGIISSAPPFSYKVNGKFSGYDVQLWNDIAKLENWKITYKYLKFDSMIPALQSHTIDAATDFFVTAERKKVIDFSDPYYSDGNGLVVLKSSGITSLSQLKGKTIVAKQGAASQLAADKLVAPYGLTVQLLTDEPSMFLALENGTVDGLVDDVPVIAYKVATSSGDAPLKLVKQLDHQPVADAFPKGSKLVAGFNSALKKLKKDGTLAKLKTKWVE